MSTWSRNRHGRHEPASTNLINALSPIRTRRPTCNKLDSTLGDQAPNESRSVVPQLTRLIHRKKAIHTVVTS
jgi:hypothetical protein